MAYNLRGDIEGTKFDRNGTHCMQQFDFKTATLQNNTQVNFLGCDSWANSTYWNKSKLDDFVTTGELINTMLRWGQDRNWGKSAAANINAGMAAAVSTMAIASSIF